MKIVKIFNPLLIATIYYLGQVSSDRVDQEFPHNYQHFALTNDGDYIFSDSSIDPNEANRSFALAKYKPNGTKVWENNYNINGDLLGESIYYSKNNGIFIVGITYSPQPSIIIIKIHDNGTLIKTKTIFQNNLDQVIGLKESTGDIIGVSYIMSQIPCYFGCF